MINHIIRGMRYNDTSRKRFKSIFLWLALSIGILICALQCGGAKTVAPIKTIPVEHERLYLQPIKGLERLQTSLYWPEDRNVAKVLIDYMETTWKNLLAEFRRCEKYGLYTMVDSTEAPTVFVSVEIINTKFFKDTLQIPLSIKTFHTANRRKHTITQKAYGVSQKDDQKQANSFYHLGAAFADYTRRFPYSEVVAVFYTKKK